MPTSEEEEPSAPPTAASDEASRASGKQYFLRHWHFVLKKALIDLSVGCLLLIPAYLLCVGLNLLAPVGSRHLTKLSLRAIFVLASLYLVAYVVTALFRTYRLIRADFSTHPSPPPATAPPSTGE